MTIMFCQSCHSFSECKVENPQPSKRTLYFEHPYMNVYARVRTCSECGESFTTYEISEDSFKAMRKAIEMSAAMGQFINQTWSSTREDFNSGRTSVSAATSA